MGEKRINKNTGKIRRKSGVTPGGREYSSRITDGIQVTKVANPGGTIYQKSPLGKASYGNYSDSLKPIAKGPTKKYKPKKK